MLKWYGESCQRSCWDRLARRPVDPTSILTPGRVTSLRKVHIRTFDVSDREAVKELWSRCGLVRPQNAPDDDIDRKLSNDVSDFLVAVSDDIIIGSVMFGYDGHRGSINYLAVDAPFAGQGIGSQLMDEVEKRLSERGCPKINLQVRETNSAVADFYKKRGYVVDEVLSLGKRL